MFAGLLVAGIGTSAALASASNPNSNEPPSTVPGSPGDDCSHGNNGKDCRPDPSEHGKDCDDHGNARGNEDHCLSTTTPSTSTDHTTTDHTTTDHTTTDHTTTDHTTTDHTTTDHTTTDHTTTDHTTTSHTTTDHTTSSTTTSTTPTTTPGSSTTPQTTSTTSTPPTGGSGPAATPPTKPELQKELAKQANRVRGAAGSHASNANELPFTGFPAWIIALIGSAMVASGLGLRKLAS